MRKASALALALTGLLAPWKPVKAEGAPAAPPRLVLPAPNLGTSVAPSKPPSVKWHTLETPHFHIHFYDDERALAFRTALIAERSHRLVTRYLNWLPSGHVSITLNDQTDTADGFASSVPRNFLFGYASPPASLDELNDFDDFLNVLITHELTHVIHLDTILGALPRAVNFLRGKVYAPNLSQPNWFVEGLAIVMESRQSSSGRLRSSFYDMHLRMPFLENRLLSLAAVSNGPLAYPQGTAAYLYGSSLLKYIEDRYGPEKLQEISHRYGSLVIPGGMNRTARQALGTGYAEIWEEWKASMARRYALQEEEAERRPLTPITRLTFDSPGPRGEGLTPRFFQDGRGVLYHRANSGSDPAFVLLDPTTGQRRELAVLHGAGGATPTPDGRALILHQVNFQKLPRRISGSSHVAWNDLFRLDLETGEIRALTQGQRAHEPDVSPDGRKLAYTVAGTGVRQLAVAALSGGDPTVLTTEAGVAYSPAWSPDGQTIAYSRWKPGGFRDIHIFDMRSGKDHPLWIDRAMDLDPRFSPDGKFLLFSSDRTGIYNIFAFEIASERLYQVTNILSGAFQPAVSPDSRRLVFTGFTSDGFDLYTTPFQPAAWPLAQPYVNARPDAPTLLASATDSPDALAADATAEPAVHRVTSYQPWKYMYPRTWLISFPSNPLGLGASLGVQTGVGDPVGNHGIGLNTLVPSDGDASVRLDYNYSGFWPLLSATLTRTSLIAGNLILDGAGYPYRQHSSSATAGMSLPFLRLAESNADLSFGYQYQVYAPADPLPVADPTTGITIAPETGPNAAAFISWSYSNARGWSYSVSPQKGRRLTLNLGISDPALGGKFSTTEVGWTWIEYLTPPWADLHALALLYSGGVGIGDKRTAFGVGGFVEQDLVRSIFLNRPRQCCLFLRGYAPNAFIGDQYHLFSAEYRAPLLWLESGYETFPLYLRRLSGAVYADAGNAFLGRFRPQDLKYGVGGELRFEFNFAYYLYTQLQLGVAKGLSKGGSTQYYFVTSFPF